MEFEQTGQQLTEFDILQFEKEKYFFVLLVIFIMYIFGASWVIDHYGGITQLK